MQPVVIVLLASLMGAHAAMIRNKQLGSVLSSILPTGHQAQAGSASGTGTGVVGVGAGVNALQSQQECLIKKGCSRK